MHLHSSSGVGTVSSSGNFASFAALYLAFNFHSSMGTLRVSIVLLLVS